VSLFAPLDSDGDRIDDVYELQRPDILDPLDPDDALLDPDGNGLTHLEEYLRALFDLDSPPQFHSREVSALNLGAPLFALDAHSREISTFNLGSPSATLEAVSRSLTVYLGAQPPGFPGIPQVASREWSVFNLESPTATVEAISRSVSVYRGEAPPTLASIPRTDSREWSVFNLDSPTATLEAISREVSVSALAPTD